MLPHGCISECSLWRPAHENERSTPFFHYFCDCRYSWPYHAGRYAYGTTAFADERAGAECTADPNLYEYAVLFVWFIHGLVTLILVFTVLPQFLVLPLIEPQ